MPNTAGGMPAFPRGPGILPGCPWREHGQCLAQAHAPRRVLGGTTALPIPTRCDQRAYEAMHASAASQPVEKAICKL